MRSLARNIWARDRSPLAIPPPAGLFAFPPSLVPAKRKLILRLILELISIRIIVIMIVIITTKVINVTIHHEQEAE